MKPPENFVPPPEILPAARLEKIQKQIAKLYSAGVAGAPRRQNRSRLGSDRARRIQHRRFRLLLPERLARTHHEVLRVRLGKRARRGGVRIVFATTRTITNKDGDMTTMFGNPASDKITFGCVLVNPRFTLSRTPPTRRLARRRAGSERPHQAAQRPIDRSGENYVRIVDRRRRRMRRTPYWLCTAITTRSWKPCRPWRRSPAAPTTRAASTCSRGRVSAPRCAICRMSTTPRKRKGRCRRSSPPYCAITTSARSTSSPTAWARNS